jgi:hypothetical protein
VCIADDQFNAVQSPILEIRLTHTIAQRVGRYLERQGLVERDTGSVYLTPEALDASDDDPSNQLLGSSITYRIAVGSQQGRKVFTLQTLPSLESDNPFSGSVGEAAGFSLHAGVATNANERAKLERLCRYITRPAVSTKRLSMTRNGQVRYELKTPWRNGTTHVIFEPLDIMYRMYGMLRAQGCAGAAISRLVALVPKPRINLTRFHGVFASNSQYRTLVTPAKRGRGKRAKVPNEAQDQTPAEKQTSITWAKRLKRVFDIDIETCSECGDEVRIIASIEDPVVISKILAYLDAKATLAATGLLPECRAPPLGGLLVRSKEPHYLQ